MNWSFDDIIEKLITDYLFHWKKREHYSKNDNQVKMDWESGKLDYIFNLFKELTEKDDYDVSNILEERLQKVFLFDPSKDSNLPIGTKVCLMQDVAYADIETILNIYELDFIEKYLLINKQEDLVYIPKGTYMTYKGCHERSANWPIFEVHEEEFEFAGDPFKLRIVQNY